MVLRCIAAAAITTIVMVTASATAIQNHDWEIYITCGKISMVLSKNYFVISSMELSSVLNKDKHTKRSQLK
jgi:hypothetical protein